MDLNRKVDQAAYSEEMPEYPARLLLNHIVLKGLQAGSVIGLGLVPLARLVRKVPLSTGYARIVPITTLVVTSVSAIAPFLMNLDDAGVDDRAFRIAHNDMQTRCDHYSVAGAGAGATTAVLFRRPLFATTCTGIAFGVGLHVIHKTGIHETIAKQIQDLLKKE